MWTPGDAPGLVLSDRVEMGVGVMVGANVTIHEGTVIGDGCSIGDNAVIGRRPVLSDRSTARKGGELGPLRLGAETRISAGAVLSAGSVLGRGCVVGDLATVRERCAIGDGVVIGRGVCVENDTAIGAHTKIQTNAYITAYCTLEEHVFIAPCVVTTNDNFMGRTERRHALIKGPTIRRGARVGGGATLLPGIEVGAEAFVGAGAIVIRDVPAGKVVVGAPARVLRDVPADERLD
jgi:acetyltransferase-like isoleucine patch superfamily enzyme